MSVSHSFRINTKAFRRAMMLIGVYSLHLVFLQALMQAAPSHNIDNTFKPLFSQHQKAPHNNQPPNHPAVSYYTQLMKQGKDVRDLIKITPVVTQSDAVVPATPSFLSSTFKLYEANSSSLHSGDDTFKRYRLIQVFLI